MRHVAYECIMSHVNEACRSHISSIGHTTHTVIHCNAPQRTAARSNTLQHTKTHCNTLPHIATHCNALQRTATHCNALQHTGPHWTTLDHTAIYRWVYMCGNYRWSAIKSCPLPLRIAFITICWPDIVFDGPSLHFGVTHVLTTCIWPVALTYVS